MIYTFTAYICRNRELSNIFVASQVFQLIFLEIQRLDGPVRIRLLGEVGHDALVLGSLRLASLHHPALLAVLDLGGHVGAGRLADPLGHLAADGAVGEDAVEEDVEALAAVEDGADPLEGEGGGDLEDPGEAQQEGEDQGVPGDGQGTSQGLQTSS